MIFVVGLGPGGQDDMTPRAVNALERSDIICGYVTYIDLIKDFDILKAKDLRPSGMKHEAERCREVLQLALDNPDKNIALVSSGDPGVYGMAGLMLEIADNADNKVEVEIIPGVTAANSAAAVLGAPLMHDFAIISLSDLLTPKDLIAKRLDAAAQADFVICLYNPASHGRPEHFKWACDILLQHKSPDTPAGWVSNIGRKDQNYKIMTLKEIRDEKLDMFCTAVIGNSQTKIKNNKMITPRGYLK